MTLIVMILILCTSITMETVAFNTKAKVIWHKKTSYLKSTISFPDTYRINRIIPTPKQIEDRIYSAIFDERIEPVSLLISEDQDDWIKTIRKVALPNKLKAIYDRLKEKEGTLIFKDKKNKTRWRIDKQMLPLLDMQKLVGRFAHFSYNVTLDLENHPELVNKLIKQLKPFSSTKNQQEIVTQLKDLSQINLKEILPPFPKKFIESFVNYRGPNCFHSAMAFQNPNYVSTLTYNVKEEVNYHRSMINYDELFRTLSLEFYEVNPHLAPLKYGDVLVFMDIPEGESNSPPYFKWIRHTTTYLVNRYTFTKGSKSANSPYMLKTVDEEWIKWLKKFPNLAFKVFRKNPNDVRIPFIRNLTDWLY